MKTLKWSFENYHHAESKGGKEFFITESKGGKEEFQLLVTKWVFSQEISSVGGPLLC